MEFFQQIWGDTEGWVYLPVKGRDGFRKFMIPWPRKAEHVVDHVLKFAADENAEVFFYAVINGKTYKADAELNGYVNWYAAELDNLDVANGEITIGVSVTTAPGGWGTIDNITLVKE